jgi:hypothetical protein
MAKVKDKKSFPFDSPGNYRIRVLGSLDERWSGRLGGLSIETSSLTEQSPVTALGGRIRDQAELSGVLNSLYELHLTLLSVEKAEGEKYP